MHRSPLLWRYGRCQPAGNCRPFRRLAHCRRCGPSPFSRARPCKNHRAGASSYCPDRGAQASSPSRSATSLRSGMPISGCCTSLAPTCSRGRHPPHARQALKRRTGWRAGKTMRVPPWPPCPGMAPPGTPGSPEFPRAVNCWLRWRRPCPGPLACCCCRHRGWTPAKREHCRLSAWEQREHGTLWNARHKGPNPMRHGHKAGRWDIGATCSAGVWPMS